MFQRGEYERAIREFREQANDGDARAQLILGLALVEGKHVSRDLAEGYAWLEIAARDDRWGDQIASRAEKAKLATSGALDGKDLIRAEQFVAGYDAAARERFGELRAEAARLLAADSEQTRSVAVDGCAAKPELKYCSGTRDAGLRPGTCGEEVPDPDASPTTRGPQAQLLQPAVPASLARHRAGFEASITYLAHVDASGFVCRAVVSESSGYPDWDAAVLYAVSRWRFQPATLQGKSVDSYVNGAVTLRLTN